MIEVEQITPGAIHSHVGVLQASGLSRKASCAADGETGFPAGTTLSGLSADETSRPSPAVENYFPGFCKEPLGFL